MPISSVSVARQYAEAAFQLAVHENTVDRWLEDLRLAAEILRDAKIRTALDSPAIGESAKFAIMRQSLRAIDPLVLNLLLLLTRRRRLGLIGVIAAEYARLVDERRGIVLATVTTAVPLDDRRTAAVAQQLSSILGKQVQLRTAVEPGIIGGLVVQVGDKLINGSIAGRLASLRRELA